MLGWVRGVQTSTQATAGPRVSEGKSADMKWRFPCLFPDSSRDFCFDNGHCMPFAYSLHGHVEPGRSLMPDQIELSLGSGRIAGMRAVMCPT